MNSLTQTLRNHAGKLALASAMVFGGGAAMAQDAAPEQPIDRQANAVKLADCTAKDLKEYASKVPPNMTLNDAIMKTMEIMYKCSAEASGVAIDKVPLMNDPVHEAFMNKHFDLETYEKKMDENMKTDETAPALGKSGRAYSVPGMA